MEEKFRINAKNLFMTFANTDQITCDMMRDHLLSFDHDWNGFVIAKENYADEEMERDNLTHMHVLVFGSKKKNYRNCREFDYTTLVGTVYHPCLESVKSIKRSYNYLQKPDRIEYLEWGDVSLGQSDSMMMKARIEECVSELEVMDCLIMEGKQHSYRFWTAYWQLWRANKATVAPIWPLANFNVPAAVTRWVATEPLLSLLLVGEPGFGKTSLARSVASSMGNYLWCTNVQDLRRYAGEATLVFDDCGLGSFSRGNLLSLFDVEQLQSVRILYGVAIIPAGVRRIFTGNSIQLLLGDHEGDGAIMRRCFVCRIGGKLW